MRKEIAMDISGKKVAMLVHNYFEQAEFEEPLEVLRDAGAMVTVITTDDTKQLQGLQHVEKGDTFTADLFLQDATPEEYDALVLPGGAINADALRMNETAQTWVRDFLNEGKITAAICHAPWLLVSADVLDGRKLTSYATIQDDIRNAGGDWVDERVVVDGSLVTSRQPDDLPAFDGAIVSMLAQGPSTDAIDAVVTSTNSFDDGSNDESVLDEQGTEDEARLRTMGYSRQRDNLSKLDLQDILGDEDESDPDESHPRSVVVHDEQDESMAT
jgi:protease I